MELNKPRTTEEHEAAARSQDVRSFQTAVDAAKNALTEKLAEAEERLTRHAPAEPGPQIPTVSRIVHYRLSAQDADRINKRREDAHKHMDAHREISNGVMVHVGNRASEGQTVAMMIVSVHGDSPDSYVNGQVFLDGNDTYWATSVKVGEGPGTWSWPSRR